MKASKHLLLTGVCLLWLCSHALSQLCPSSALAPVFKQDFGQGTTATSTTQAISGSTNYIFGGVGTDGNYVITPDFSVSGKADWTKLGDHTGDANGNMFLVNAGGGKSVFFKQTVNGLCSGSTFNFSAWLANANTSATQTVCGSGYKYPKVIFNIKDINGNVLATMNTGNLPLSPVNGPANWQQYGMQFTLPAGVNSLVLEMVDALGGAAACGNDLALDDILFTACTPQVSVTLSTATAICSGTSTTISTSLVNSPFTSPAYQWQKSTDNGVTWSNIGTPGTTADKFPLTNVTAGDNGSYRVLVGPDVASLSSNSCITASNAIEITVNSKPTVTITSSSPVCSGYTLAFSSTAAGGLTPYSYSWSGPNSFTSTIADPSIPNTATAASGVYSLTITDANGCTLTASTTVTINPTPVVAAITGISGGAGGCLGTTLALSNTTIGGSWSSSDPLVAPISSSGVVTMLSPGTAIISYTVSSGGCSQAATKTITVAGVKLQSDVIACNSAIQFDQSPFIPYYSGNLPGDAYNWNISAAGGSVNYLDGTNASSQFPHVQLADGAVYTVALTYTTNGVSCAATQLIYKSIIPADTIQLSHDTTVCNSTAALSLTATASLVTNSFSWTTTGSGSFSNPTALTTTYTLSAADKAAGSIKIYISGWSNLPTTGSCSPGSSPGDSILVRVVPLNTGVSSLQTTCSGQPLNFTPASSVPASLFAWTSVVTTGTASGNTSSGTGNITDILVNPAASVTPEVTYTITPYTITPAGVACNGVAFTYVVAINPVASIQALTAVTCSGVSFAVSPVNGTHGIVPAGTVYSWGLPGVTGGMAGAATASNSIAVNGSLINNTTVAQTATYLVTPVSGACTGASFSVSILVNPVAVVNNLAATSCSGISFSAIPTGMIPAGTVFSWATPSTTGGLTGGGAATNATTVSGTLVNTGNIAQTATYIITPIAGGCSGSNFSVTVSVLPVAYISPLTATTCSGVGFVITPANGVDGIVPVNTIYTWNAPVVTGGLTGLSGTNAAAVSGAFGNTGNAAETATYTVWPSTGNCAGGAFTVTVAIDPVASITEMSATSCSGVSFAVNPAAPAGTVYNWTAPVVTGGMTGGIAGNTTSVITGTLAVTGNTAETAVYIVTPVSGSCNGNTFTVTVIVNPVADISPMSAALCGGVLFALTPTNGINGIVPNGTVYNWAAPVMSAGLAGGTAANGAAGLTGTLTNNANATGTAVYTVSPLTGGCAGSAFTVTINVYPVAMINAFSTSSCTGVSFGFTPVNGANGIVPPGTLYSWNAPSATAGLSGAVSGANATGINGTLVNASSIAQTATYSIVPTSGTCTGPAFTVTIAVLASARVVAMSTITCSGTFISITPVDITNGIVPVGTTYSWAPPSITGGVSGALSATSANDISALLVNTTNIAQTATYYVTPISGSCTGDVFTATITLMPVATLNAMSGTVCSGIPFGLTPVNNSNGTVPAATTYSWPVPVSTGGLDGGVSATNATSISGQLFNPTNTAQTATYLITPVSGVCTGNVFTVNINIDPVATVNAITATTCSGITFTLTPANNIIPAGTTYRWPAPLVTGGATGGAAAANETSISGVVFNSTNTTQTATYSITPVSGACTGNAFTATISVDPVAQIAAMSATTCSGIALSITPVNNTNGLIPAGTVYNWNIPSVSAGISGAISNTGAAGIDATLTNATNTAGDAVYIVTPISGSCVGSAFTITVSVLPIPAISDFTFAICSGGVFGITPTNGVNGIVPAGSLYSWPTPSFTAGITNGMSATNETLPSGRLFNTTNAVQTATYLVTPVSGVCSGSAFTVTVSVTPVATINALALTTCTGILFAVTPTDGANGVIPAGTTYNWAQPIATGITGGISSSHANAISGLLTNTGNSAGTATYIVVPSSTGCDGLAFTVTVTVNPSASITQMSAVTCSGVFFSLTPADGINGIIPAGTVYSWAAPAVTGGLGGGASVTGTLYIAGTLYNVANTVQYATYSVVPQTGACAGNAFSVNVQVDPVASISPLTIITCSGTSFGISPSHPTNGIVPAGTTYSWSAPAVTGGMQGGAGFSNATAITGSLTNAGNAAQTATYIITPASGSCIGATFVTTVTVDPVANISPITIATCSGIPFSYTPSNAIDGIVPAGISYYWAAPASTAQLTGGATATNAGAISGTLFNSGSSAQTATYTVTPLTASCTGPVFTVTVSVAPVASVTSFTTVTCSGIPFSITPVDGASGIVPSGTMFSWNTPVVTGAQTGATSSTNVSAISGTLTNPTASSQTATYSITPLSGNCTGSSFTVTVTVSPVAGIHAISTTTCSGVYFSITPTDNSDGVVPAGTRYNWNTPLTTGAVTGGSAGANGSDVSGSLTNTGSATQRAVYQVAPVTGACTGSPFTVTVVISPVAAINPMSVSLCSGASFNVTPADGTNGVVPAGTVYNWFAPSTPAAINGAIAGTNAGTIGGVLTNTSHISQTVVYDISAVSGNCSSVPFSVTVLVRPLPKAELNVTKAIDCSPFTIDNHIVYPGIYNGANDVYSWYVDNVAVGNSTQIPAFVLTDSAATIKLQVSSLYNCGTDETSYVIKTHSSPSPSFSLSDSAGCGPLAVTVVNTTPDQSAYRYTWTSDQNMISTQAQPGQVTWASSVLGGDTTYNVTLKAYRYCDTFHISKQVTVSRKAKVDFTAAAQNSCSPLVVFFKNQSAGVGAQYKIDFGDGVDSLVAPNSQFSHIYYAGAQTSYSPALYATNGCGTDSTTTRVNVAANRVRVDVALSNPVACGNNFSVLIANRTDSADHSSWDFGDGSPIQTTGTAGDIRHTYASAGNYLITNHISGTCSDTVIYRQFKSHAGVTAAARTSITNNCIGNAIRFVNTSDNTLSSKWLFGDGNSSDSSLATHAYAQAGVYTAKLAVWKTYTDITCSDTLQQVITIVDRKEGQFTMTNKNANCVPFAVSYSSQNTTAAQTTWSWGDGEQTTGDSVTHHFTRNGNYTVTVEAKEAGGCVYADTALITIAAPDVSLQYKGGAYCKQNNAVDFTPVSSLTDSIRWDFGDGSTIVAPGGQKVSHTYKRRGGFLPKLTLLNGSCAVPVTAQDSIYIDELSAGFKLTAINECAKTNYNFTDTSRSYFPITKRIWNLDQRQSGIAVESNAKEVNKVYTTPGDYSAGLEIQNRIGCKASLDATFSVQVYDFPQASISSINDACLYSLMEIRSNVSSQDSIIRRLWNLGNGSAATDTVVKVQYSSEGNYTVKLTVGTINSCYDSVYKQLSVHPIPNITLTPDKTVCKGDSIQLKASGAVGYIWKDQDNNIVCNNCSELQVAPQKTTQYKVVGYTEFGCSNITSTNIKIVAPFKLGLLASDSMCEGSTKRIDATGADLYQWMPAPGLSSYNSASTLATPSVTTTYKVVGRDAYNCFTDTATIRLVIGRPTPVNIGNDTTVVSGTPIVLNTVLNSQDIKQWQWGGKADYSCVFCQSPTVKVIDDQDLFVKATNRFGCITSDTIHVKTFCSGSEVFIPNAFSPDGDGVNDLLIVQGRGIKVVKSFRIYTRWGEMVFEKNNFAPGDKSAAWDGTIRGKKATTDVFVYLCEAVCEKGTPYTFKGNVAIIK